MSLARFLPVLGGLFCSFLAGAQSKGTVKVNVAPYGGTEYILDGKERLVNPALVLPAGPHRFVFYAPDRALLDTTITVQADTTVALRATLRYTPEYLAYRAACRKVSGRRLLYRAGPLVLTGVSAFLTYNAMRANTNAYDALVDAEAEYATLRSPGAITTLKGERMTGLEEDFKTSRRNVAVWGTVTGVAAAFTIYGFIRAAKLDWPAYEDREKVRFNGMAWVPGQHGGWYASLTIPIR